MESGGCLVVPAVFKTVGRRSSRLRCVRFAPSPPLLANLVFTLFAIVYDPKILLFSGNNTFPSFVIKCLFLVKWIIFTPYSIDDEKTGEKMKFRGITIRERTNASGTVSFRVECPLAWFVRTDLKQFTSKERAKGFIDGQLNDQERFESLAKPITSLIGNFRRSSTPYFKSRLEEIKSHFLAHFQILHRCSHGGLNSWISAQRTRH